MERFEPMTFYEGRKSWPSALSYNVLWQEVRTGHYFVSINASLKYLLPTFPPKLFPLLDANSHNLENVEYSNEVWSQENSWKIASKTQTKFVPRLYVVS